MLNISPGFTGLFNGDYRFSSIFRSQWSSVPVSYSTFNMNAEQRLSPKQLGKDMLGIGLVFNNDKAGDARYAATQLYGNLSYIFLAKPDSSLIITLGTSFGFNQVGFDYTKMTFDSQFDGLQYNRSLGTGESFNWTQYNYLDLNLGSAVQYVLKHRHRFMYGLAFHHVTGPVISYQGNDISKLDYKVSNYLSYNTPLGQKTELITEALFSLQGKNYEIIPHASLKYFMNKADNLAISGGMSFRARDAIVFRVGYFNKTLQAGMAYDINTSKFNAATNRRGAFELFVNYVLKLKPTFKAKRRDCPVFM